MELWLLERILTTHLELGVNKASRQVIIMATSGFVSCLQGGAVEVGWVIEEPSGGIVCAPIRR